MPEHDRDLYRALLAPGVRLLTRPPAPAGRHTPLRAAARLRPEHLYKFAGLLFLFAVAFHFLGALSRVLLLAYAAGIVAVAVNALQKRLPLRRKWVAALVGLALLTILAAAVWFGGGALWNQARALVERAPELEAELRGWGERLRRQTGLDVTPLGRDASDAARSFFLDLDGGQILGRTGTLLELLLLPLLILLGGLFAVASPNQGLLAPLLQTVPLERQPAFRRMFALLGERLTGWLKGQLISMTAVGLLATLAFYLIGVPYAFLLGVINGLAEFVPIIGPWAGGIPAVVVAFLDEPSKGLWTAGAILVIQQIESNLITPFVMSKAAEVHPFITLFATVLFGSLFGFLGVLLALPLVLLIWTAVQVLWVERAMHTGSERVAPVVEE